MRNVSWLLGIVVLVLIVPWRGATDDLITVVTTQQALENNSGGPIFLPGCHPFEVEEFKEDAYLRVKRDACAWEGLAVKLDPGLHEFTFQTSEEDAERIFRISMAYGTGCREGTALSRGKCTEFGTAESASFRVSGKK
jgi:hypothetical protein